MRLSTSLVLFAASSATLVLAQATADTVSAEQTTLSTAIPGDCSTDCQAWLSALALCPTDTTDTTYQTCLCDATFQSNFATCSACFVSVADTNAATATTAETDLSSFCGTTAATTSLTESSTTTESSSSTTTTEAAATTSSTSTTTSSSSSSAASDSSSSMVTTTSTTAAAATIDFPTQTKSANVFSGAVPEFKAAGGVAAVVLGAVAGVMML